MDKPVRNLIFLCAVITLSACAPVEIPVATPLPTQQVWRVVFPSEMDWLRTGFSSCLVDLPGYSLVVEENQQISQTFPEADFLFSWGDIDPKDRQAYQIGTDSLAVIVNAQNPLDEMDTEMLRRVYRGEMTRWDELNAGSSSEIMVWRYADHLALQQAFESAVDLSGSTLLETWTAPDVSAMIEAVSSSPEAVGFIPGAWDVQESGVKTLGTVQGVEVPLVVLTIGQPSYEQQVWLNCLREILYP